MIEDKTILAVSAMACITLLEVYALSQGINGTALALVLTALAGLGGYTLGRRADRV